jgi:hypothetical protein
MKIDKAYVNLMIAAGIVSIAVLLTYILRTIVEYNNLPKPPSVQQSVIDSITPLLRRF